MVAEQLSHVARLSKKPGHAGQSSGTHRTNRPGYPPEIKGGMLENTSHFEAGWWFEPTPLKNHGVKVTWDDFPFPSEWKVMSSSHVFQSPPTRSP